jgi:hypothetical protein
MFRLALALGPRPHDKADEVVGDDEGGEEAWLDEDIPLRCAIGDVEAVRDRCRSMEARAFVAQHNKDTLKLIVIEYGRVSKREAIHEVAISTSGEGLRNRWGDGGNMYE